MDRLQNLVVLSDKPAKCFFAVTDFGLGRVKCGGDLCRIPALEGLVLKGFSALDEYPRNDRVLTAHVIRDFPRPRHAGLRSAGVYIIRRLRLKRGLYLVTSH